MKLSMTEQINYTGDVIGELLSGKNTKATKYVSPTLVVRGTRVLYGKRIDPHDLKVVLSICKPNYIEREFIKLCKKAKEPFPVKNVQVKPYNPKPKQLKNGKKRKG